MDRWMDDKRLDSGMRAWVDGWLRKWMEWMDGWGDEEMDEA